MEKHHEATFADYATMKEGDNVYFFIIRKIYGVGELVSVGRDCKYCNFPHAGLPQNFEYNSIRNTLLWNEGNFNNNQRWICLFKPAPYFFRNGIDMDDILSSNPDSFRMLRAFWKVSFIKFDDEENQAFRDALLKFNQDALTNNHNDVLFNSNFSEMHERLRNDFELENYLLDVGPILESCSENNKLKHEMAIEAGLLYQLSNDHNPTELIFGRWDYLSHQVIALPFKPIDYMDKMDVFGYSYITGYNPT